jgi:CRP/FNR family transcriptional regulator, dissimilatory nitrate respiration regulator
MGSRLAARSGKIDPTAPLPNATANPSMLDWLTTKVRRAATERTLKAGQHLFRAGDRTAGLYEVIQGKVRLVRVDRTGREAVLQTAGAGETLAEASLFSPTYHCDAIANTAATVRLYPRTMVLNELKRNPKCAQAFATMLAQQVMTLRARLEQRNIHSARDRVRHYFMINADPHGRRVVLPGTVKSLAGELGLSHEALYRTLADMAAQGEIERSDDGTIRLLKAPV